MLGQLLGAVGFVIIGLVSVEAAASPALDPNAPPTAASNSALSVNAPRRASGGSHTLTKDDVEAYLDGMIPTAFERAGIAGGVVAIVKDGRVLLEKGYGYSDVNNRQPVDPTTTMFRPGSISKLFTWTAVMQLQEQGRLDLDADVNKYLDFRIPQAWGKPVTLRDLMTHTSGFEETIKNLMASDPRLLRPLDKSLKDWIPERMYAPGAVPAYSNYGAALAGYIVQRVSREPFEQYIEHHIFQPLEMHHSTFVQPLPKQFQADMSKGYMSASGEPQPFELISMRPAGALSATADDLSRFMMAHLNDGAYGSARILRPETARLMHATALQLVPEVPGIGLGFYHEDRNGHSIVGHGGDTQWFHSDMHLILDENVGLFISVNSAGNEGLFTSVRRQFFDGIMDRYFPVSPAADLPPLRRAKADAERIAGLYFVSRRSDSNFGVVGAFAQQIPVKANDDGTISIAAIRDKTGKIKKFREIRPGLWHELNGQNVIVAKEQDGHISYLTSDIFPQILVLQPVPFFRSVYWVGSVLGASLIMLTLTVIFWPIKAMLRWRYGQRLMLTGRALSLYRLTRVVAFVDVLFLVGWLAFFLLAQFKLSFLDTPSDPYLRALQALGLLGIVGIVFPAGNLWMSLGDASRPWWTKITDCLVLASTLIVAYYAVALHLLSVSLSY